MSKKAFFAGKALIAAACALTVATAAPAASTFAYSVDYGQEFAKTEGYKKQDVYYDVTTTKDGGAIVSGAGRVKEDSNAQYAVLVKYDADGNKEWTKIFNKESTTTSNDAARKTIELASGNFLTVGSINGQEGVVEIDKDTQEIVATGNISGITDIIQFSDNDYLGVADDAYIRIISRVSSGTMASYTSPNATNMDNGDNIVALRNAGDGFIAIGHKNYNSTLYIGDRLADSPDTIPVEGALIYDATLDKDGNIIAVGSEDGMLSAYKYSPAGRQLQKTIIAGNLAGGLANNTRLIGVDILDNGEIAAAGISTYTESNVVEGIHFNGDTEGINKFKNGDGVVVRFDKDLSVIKATAIGGTNNDTILGMSASGNSIYVAGNSQSDDFGVENVAKDGDDIHIFGFFARISQLTTANVTFKIDGETPKGAATPANGDYVWTQKGDNNIPAPTTPAGYIFSGWYTDKDLTDELGKQVPTDDLTLYGKFIETTDSSKNKNLDCTGNPVSKCTSDTTETVDVDKTTDPIKPFVPADYTGGDYTGKWVSADEKIATVNQNGKITGVSEGETEVYFIVSDADGNEIYRFVQPVKVGEDAAVEPEDIANTDDIDNPATLDNFSAILLVALASSAMLGFGIATKANRR